MNGPPSGERVELWREPSGFWRWRYVNERDDGTDDIRLLSHMEFTTEGAARDAAAVAYPDIVIEPMNRRHRDEVAASAKGAVAAVIAVVATGAVVTRVTRRRRRSSRRRLR